MNNYYVIKTIVGFNVHHGPISEIVAKVNTENEARQSIKNHIDYIIKWYNLDDDTYVIEDDRLNVNDGDCQYIFTVQKFN